MDPATAQRLLRLNHEFYQRFALDFADTRQRLQPGVSRLLQEVLPSDSVLDLGCGNGPVLDELARLGHYGHYLGVDSSQPLLRFAQAKRIHPSARFLHIDLTGADWSAQVGRRFRHVFAFALLHHIPGAELRQRFLHQVRRTMRASSVFSLSVWNFLASEKLRGRIVPWQEIDIDEAEVGPQDFLLNWRRGGQGLRYVHYFTGEELKGLAADNGFNVIDSYLADGHGGRLGRYQRWRLAPQRH